MPHFHQIGDNHIVNLSLVVSVKPVTTAKAVLTFTDGKEVTVHGEEEVAELFEQLDIDDWRDGLGGGGE